MSVFARWLRKIVFYKSERYRSDYFSFERAGADSKSFLVQTNPQNNQLKIRVRQFKSHDCQVFIIIKKNDTNEKLFAFNPFELFDFTTSQQSHINDEDQRYTGTWIKTFYVNNESFKDVCHPKLIDWLSQIETEVSIIMDSKKYKIKSKKSVTPYFIEYPD